MIEFLEIPYTNIAGKSKLLLLKSILTAFYTTVISIKKKNKFPNSREKTRKI